MNYINNNINNNFTIFNKTFGFQDSASPIMEGIIGLHHSIFYFLILMTILVVWFLFSIYSNSFYITKNFAKFLRDFEEPIKQKILTTRYNINFNKYLYKYLSNHLNKSHFNHNSILEIIWTILPAVILVFIAIPSFGLLYASDEIIEPVCLIEVLGHQWYWSYEITLLGEIYKDLNIEQSIAYDSYMISEEDLEIYQIDLEKELFLRLLDVDNYLFLPARNYLRFIITSTDVIHSWAIPSLGVKIDAIPGRMNQCSIYIKRTGYFYGQCSEICGINHGFMPISIIAMDYNEFISNFVLYQEIFQNANQIKLYSFETIIKKVNK